MKRFLLYISGLAIIIGIMLFALDLAYTSVYKQNVTNSKFQFIRGFSGQKIDYIFLGSSRVENNINPKVFEQETGKTAVNFGVQGARLKDIYLLLKLIDIYHIEHDRIYIQLDYIYNMPHGHSNIFEYQLVPFVNEHKPIAAYFNDIPDAFYIQYLPFVRYALYDNKQGIRNLFTNALKKNLLYTRYDGFCPKTGPRLNSNFAFPENMIVNNSVFHDMTSFIKEKKMDVTFFCSPVRQDTGNLEYITELSDKIPEFKDYSKAIKNDLMFIDNLHLNNKGATLFTQLITQPNKD